MKYQLEPQLENTVEDIDRSRREREGREERGWRERGAKRNKEKRARIDTDSDVESTQFRQKKGQMKSIFLSDSDEEAIIEFVKQHEELYDKTNNSFKEKQKKESLNFNQHRHQCNLPLIRNSQDLPASPGSTVRVNPNQQISPHKMHQTRPFKGPPESSKNN